MTDSVTVRILKGEFCHEELIHKKVFILRREACLPATFWREQTEMEKNAVFLLRITEQQTKKAGSNIRNRESLRTVRVWAGWKQQI